MNDDLEPATRHEDGYPTIQDSWVWPDRIERLFRDRAAGFTLHVCCGNSDVGDVLVDADADREPDVQGDMFALPFGDCTFDTVIADPPWHGIQHVGKKHTLFFELLRLVKPNGRVLWNALTLPSSEQAELEKTWVRQDFEEGKASIIAEYRRYPDQQTFTDAGAYAATDGGSRD